MVITFKTKEEIELIRKSALLVAQTHATIVPYIKEGVTGKYLDKIAEEFIRDNNATPAFKGFNGFPASLCISVNEQIVHGIPSDKPFESGDIVSIDCGTNLEGYYGDSAYTYSVGEVSEEVQQLLKVTRESLYLGIEQSKIGNRIGDIGFAIQSLAEKEHGYGVVRELVGHGVGKSLHEPPEVPNFGRRGNGAILREGMVLAIEPMVNLGTKQIVQLRDGWTIVTRDGKPSAHFEHTIAVGKEKGDILSSFELIEKEIKKNKNLAGIFE